MKFRSTLVDQGSGVLGTLVVEKNGVMRTRNIPANPNTSFQQERRAVITDFAVQWRDTLSQPERDAWNAYAATVSRKDVLGKDVKLSGINVFVAGNAVGALVGMAAITTAPVTVGSLAIPQVTNVVIDDSANTAIFTLAADASITEHYALFLSPDPVSPGRSSYQGPYRFHSGQDGAGSPTLTFAGVTGLVAGQKFGWRLACVDDEGRVAKAQTGLTLVVA